jgi:hypothetical protein
MSGLPELPEFHGVTRDALIDYIKEQIRFSRQMTDYCCKLEARIIVLEKQAMCVITIGSGGGTSGPYSASGTFGISSGSGTGGKGGTE